MFPKGGVSGRTGEGPRELAHLSQGSSCASPLRVRRGLAHRQGSKAQDLRWHGDEFVTLTSRGEVQMQFRGPLTAVESGGSGRGRGRRREGGAS